MPSLLKKDPFSPILFNSPALTVTMEQLDVIREVLDVACSDSRFAEKAYTAILLTLTKGITIPPAIASLTPSSAEIGDPNFLLHVHGTGFKNTDTIVFAGVDEPTTFVGPTELTTGVDMSVWLGPDELPVYVRSAEGVMSNSRTFTFTDGTPLVRSAPTKTQEMNKKEAEKKEK